MHGISGENMAHPIPHDLVPVPQVPLVRKVKHGHSMSMISGEIGRRGYHDVTKDVSSDP